METKVSDSSGQGKVQLAHTLLLMAEQQKRRRGAVEMGPTAATVATNIRRIRGEVRGWSTYELSGKLTKAGRPIAPSAIAKIERGERLVTVDDLMAIACALDVNPNALLLPPLADGSIELTGAGSYPAGAVWDWAEGNRPLDLPDGDDGTAHNTFQADARPAGRRKFRAGPVKMRLTDDARKLMAQARESYRQQTGEEIDDDTLLDLMTGRFNAMFKGSVEGREDG